MISLCICGLSAAASAPRQRTPRQFGNSAVIVNQVVDTLQPEIASAVANALAALQAQQAAAERAAFERDFANQNAGANSDSSENYAEYNYKYQVRDDEEGNYIYKNEARDGLEVTGQYGYVNPEGTLVTVNYRAGPDGFYPTIEKEVDFLRSGSASGRAPAPQPRPVARPQPTPAFDDSALIAQIVRTLQPQIAASVDAAISQQQQVTSVTRSQGVSANGDRLVPLFGFNRA